MLQSLLFAPQSNWRPPSLSDLPDWSRYDELSFDAETRDETLRELGCGARRDNCYAVGYGFAFPDRRAFYLPIRHLGGDNLPEDNVLRYLRDQTKVYRGRVVGAHLPYDIDYANKDDIWFHDDVVFHDVQIAEPLLYELDLSYSLDNICKKHGIPGKDKTMLKQALDAYGLTSNDIWKLPARYVGQYNEQDCLAPLDLIQIQRKLIEEKKLQQIWELECELLPILVWMRQQGVLVNMDRVQRVEENSLLRETKALELIKHITGFSLSSKNVWQAKALGPILEAVGVPVPRTEKGAYSVKKGYLKHFAPGKGDDNPSAAQKVVAALLEARSANKLRTTFCASVRKHAIKSRVHYTFKQLIGGESSADDDDDDEEGARYGRLSCVDPNGQQQVRDKEWRSIYVAEEGCFWGSSDFSQQEPRWATHYAAQRDLPKARETAKAYRENFNLDNHQFMSELVSLPRDQAKIMYLSMIYGKGDAKVCIDLGLPVRWAVKIGWEVAGYADTKHEAMALLRKIKKEIPAGGRMPRIVRVAGVEGQRIIDTFNERAPFLKQLARIASERAAARGYVITGGGRVLHFPMLEDGSYDWLHKALNRIIQGTSADQMKRAMINVFRELRSDIRAGRCRIPLQVHDELNGSYTSVRQHELVSELMRDSMKSVWVPFIVGNKRGPSWGEAVEVEKTV